MKNNFFRARTVLRCTKCLPTLVLVPLLASSALAQKAPVDPLTTPLAPVRGGVVMSQAQIDQDNAETAVQAKKQALAHAQVETKKFDDFDNIGAATQSFIQVPLPESSKGKIAYDFLEGAFGDQAFNSVQNSIGQKLKPTLPEEKRAALFLELMRIASKSPAQRDEYETAALNYFGLAVKEYRIDCAESARAEYLKWRSNPYTYNPPAGAHYDRPFHNPIGDAFSKPKAPDVLDYGVKQATAYWLQGHPDAPATTLKWLLLDNAPDAPKLGQAVGVSHLNTVATISGAGAAGVAAGGALFAGAGTGGALFAAIFPSAAAVLAGTAGTSSAATTAAAAASMSTGVFGAAFAASGGIVLANLAVGILEGINVVKDMQTPDKIQDAINKAQNEPAPDTTQLLKSEAGRLELFTVLVGGAVQEGSNTRHPRGF